MNAIRKAWDVVTNILVVAIVILAVLLVGARFAGFKVFTVLSGSMEPAYHTGSVIYVKEVDTDTLAAGDVITFMVSEDTVATHRIVQAVPDDDEPDVIRFMTKGDANESVDGTLVHYKNVIGKPVRSIPYLGYIASYIQNPPGTYIAVAAVAFVLMLSIIPDLFADDEEEEQKA